MSSSLDSRIESFAELMARLDDPFADRAAVLGEAALDEGACRRLQDRWGFDLSGDEGGGELARRFGDAYEEACRALARDRHAPAAAAADARFLRAEVQAFREEAAAVPLGAPGEAPPPASSAPALAGLTASARAESPRDELPPTAPGSPAFAPAALTAPRILEPVAPAPDLLFVPPAPARIARPPAHLAATADISAFVPRKAAVPFAAPSEVPKTAAPAPTASPAPTVALPPSSSRVGSGTADISAFVPRPKAATPFLAPPEPAPPSRSQPFDLSASVALAPPHGAQLHPTIPLAVGPGAPAPPFDPSSSALIAAPRRRLMRFDPQTGQPLAEPIWVDLPDPPPHR